MTTKHDEAFSSWENHYGSTRTGPVEWCGVSQDFANSGLTQTMSFDRTGGPTEGWKSKVKAKTNASGSLQVDMWVKNVGPNLNDSATFKSGPLCGNAVDYVRGGGPGWTIVADAIPDDSSQNASLIEDVKRLASRRAFKRLREFDTQFQGAVFMGQITKTFRMLLSPMKSLKEGVSSYLAKLQSRRGKGRRRSDLQKILSDTWLETVFGWQPLLHDVQDAAKLLARVYSGINDDLYRSFRINASKKNEGNPVYQGDMTVFGLKYQIWDLKTFRYQRVYYGELKHLGNPTAGLDSLSDLVRLSGFDLRSFVPTAWELLPWSFLIDYFTNVGDIIDAYSTDLSSLVRISGVEVWETTLRRSLTPVPAFANTYYGSDFVSAKISGTSCDGWRKIIVRWPYDGLAYPGLHFTLDPSFKQIANIGALVLANRHRLTPYYS